jgi:putative nucleotidyltransferase with HDIG domain
MEQDTSLKEIIEQELTREEIDLPIIKEMASKLGHLLGNDDADINNLSQMIEKDPSLTAKVLNLSNSVFYRGLGMVKSVDRAIARVGLSSIRNFLTTVSLKNVFKGEGAHFQERFKINWRHCLGCAVCCKRIAEHLKLRSSEDAYLVGLLHDIGVISIFNSLSKVSNRRETNREFSDELVNEIIGSFHASIGAKVLTRLNFEERLCKIVEFHHHPDEYPVKDDSLYHILQISDMIMRKIGIAFDPDPDLSIVSKPDMTKLGLDPLFVAILEVDLEDALVNMENMI